MSRGPDFKALIAQHGSPLLLLDCGVVRRQYKSLQAALPGVGLFYALKPLPHPAVVAALRDLGGCFDVATSGEIKLVKARGGCARALHPHASDQDRRRNPRSAALRHPHVRGRQSRRAAQVPQAPHPGGRAAAPVVSRSDGGRRPVAQVRLRAGGGRADARTRDEASASRSGACRSTWARRSRSPGNTSRPSGSAPS